jgi:hypothetical protein
MTDQRAEIIREMTGRETVKKFQLSILKENGVLVDIDISGSSIFIRRANFAELGVADPATMARYTQGNKYLIPEEFIKLRRSIESRVRQNLENHSFRITGFAPYRWVPVTAYKSWRADHDELVVENDVLREEIISRRDEFLDLLSKDFAQVAEAAWRSIMAGGYEVVIYNEMQFVSKEEFIDAVVAEAQRMFPTEEQIRTGMTVDYVTAVAYSDVDFETDQLEADHIRNQINEERERARARAETLRLFGEETRLKIQHDQRMREFAEENERVELRKRETELEAMRVAEIEHARKRLQEVASPFEEVILSLRQTMADAATSMLESIQRNGCIRGKVADQGRGLLQMFELMAAHSDDELRERLTQLKTRIGEPREELSKAEKDTKVSNVIGTLEEIQRLVKVQAEELTEVSRAAFLEL